MRLLLLLAILFTFAPSAAPQAPPLMTTPVVFVSGYQLSCFFYGGFTGTFGAVSSLLSASGIQSAFYDTCQCSGCSIEDHAKQLANAISSLRRPDGTSVDQVDVVAMSMGGLILRSYLAGKNSAVRSFEPPLNPKVRKAIFIATPHFGLTAPPIDRQLKDMLPGSRFLWELSTWNQGRDDLRGVDSIAIAGNGGSRGGGGIDDGLVPLTSASLNWVAEDARTRVLPYCHTDSLPFIVSCKSDAKPIAQIDSLNHPTFRIIRSFLSDTEEWRTVGTPPSGNDVLATNGGILISLRDAKDAPLNASSVRASGLTRPAEQYTLQSRTDAVFYQELMTAQPYRFMFLGGSTEATVDASLPAGATVAVAAKLSPSVARVIPAAALLPHLSLAPGMIVSLFGADMAPRDNASVLFNGAALPLLYKSNSQINAILPAAVQGLAKLTLRNSLGEHTIDVMIEPAVPAVFALSGNGVGSAAATDASTGVVISPTAPARSGQSVALYATGLGATTRVGSLDVAAVNPTVTIGGRAARVLYAGRAPGFPGLDQINVEVPDGVASIRDSVVLVRSGFRVSNPVSLAVR
ncbi:MAG: hypothetical protein ABI822_25145 [Bryobacteraceae bacterium]